ncbi:MAG: ABC transporter permease [Deltaproteobacteria bacterium]|nr:ABC transporter permease [Deltaproteobacteria bacterium]
MNPFIQSVKTLGDMILFACRCLKLSCQGKTNWHAVLEQIFQVGVKSLGMTVTAGLFVGAIMALQIDVQLKDFGAEAFLGGLSTSTTLRNVGPVLIAFLLSGKVGAYTSAELGTMEVTEQLNAIRLLGADPVEYIILPRAWAVVISSFLLLIVGLMVTILGGVVFSQFIGVNPLSYIQNIPRIVTGWSLGLSIIKSFIFGLLIAIVSCYKGYKAHGGAVGVGVAVQSCAVTNLILIIFVDFFLSMLSSLLQDVLQVGYF